MDKPAPGSASRPAWLWPLVAVLVLLLSAPLACRAQGGVDLLDVLRQARAADPQLAAADALRRAVGEGVAQARAPLLPQAGASWAIDQTRGGVAGTQHDRGATLSLSQAVFDRGGLHRLKAAEALADAQDARFRAAEQALLLRVATAYLGVLGAQDVLANVQANEAAFAQQVAQADERFRNGLSAAVDVEQARAYHASARAATIVAQRALADARAALAEITGANPGVLKTLRDELPMAPPEPADPQAWADAALARNPLLLAQRSVLGAAERQIDAARAGHLPTLSAGVVVGRSNAWPQAGGNDGRNITTLGLQLNVPLFAGGATQSAQRQALHQRDGVQSDLEAQRRRVVREVLEHHRAVESGIAQLEATQAAVAAARKALASTRVGQGLGTQTMNELLQAITTLGAAQNAHSAARHQFILSRLRLQLASGALGESDLAAVNALLQ